MHLPHLGVPLRLARPDDPVSLRVLAEGVAAFLALVGLVGGLFGMATWGVLHLAGFFP